MMRRAVGALAILVAVSALAACAVPGTSAPGSARSPTSGAVVFPPSQVAPLVAAVPHRSVAAAPAMRLAKGLVPPTNRWFSGLVFGAAPQPVFPLPLSFGLTASGFTFGLPHVATSADAITGPNNPAISVDTGAASSQVSAYDQASVTIAERDSSGATTGSIVIAEGSPLVSYTAKSDSTLTLGTSFAPAGKGVWSASVGGTSYGLVTDGEVAGTSLRLRAGATAVWFPVPDGGSLTALARYARPLSGVTLSYGSGGKAGAAGAMASTALRYRAAGATLIAAMPHQLASLTSPKSRSLGSYPSIYGTLVLRAGTTLSWTSPAVAPAASLPLGSLSTADRAALRTQVAADAGASQVLPTDTYFGGKALARLANLLEIAKATGDTASAGQLQEQLSSALVTWTEPQGCATRGKQCFVYDPAVHGMVGLTASFGADQFNDHHFHYGYFLFAAGVAVAEDPSLLAKIAPVMNLLAADLASSGAGTAFPSQRVFDPYQGHSWASGYSLFADGNNQESSSEAINAWNGLALWAAASHNAALGAEARWMLAAETASATAYWTGFNQADPVYHGYAHSIVSLNWGAKRVYETWFSPAANAKLAILTLPLNPGSNVAGLQPSRVGINLTQAASSGYDVAYGDYLLMYSALEGPAQAKSALAAAETLPSTSIDQGNSRSYLLAWIMAHGG